MQLHLKSFNLKSIDHHSGKTLNNETLHTLHQLLKSAQSVF